MFSGFEKELRGGLVWIILAIPCSLFFPLSYTAFPVLLRHVCDLWDLAGDQSALHHGNSWIIRVLWQLIRIRMQVCLHGLNLDPARLIFDLAGSLRAVQLLCSASKGTGQ